MEKRKTIGVLIGNIHTDHPQRIIEGLYQEYSKKAEVDVHIFMGSESAAFFKGNASKSADYDYQYLCLYDYSFFDQLDASIISIGSMSTLQKIPNKKNYIKKYEYVPSIILEDTIIPLKGSYIISNNYVGMYQNVTHLIEEHGYQNIVFLCGPRGNKDSDERFSAYKDCMVAHQLKVTPKMFEYGDYSEYVDEQVERLFERNKNIDAIVSANDEMTVAVYRVCEKKKLVVGRDIAVTGFDNMDVATFLRPPLTTIRQRSFYIGMSAARSTMDLLAGKDLDPQRISVEFISRNSCGCSLEREAAKEDEETSITNVADEMRKVLHRSMMGPFLIRELFQIAEDENLFFHEIAFVLSEMGARSSYLYLLPETIVNKDMDSWKLPDELHLAVRQEGKNIYSFDPSVAPIIKQNDGLFQMNEDDAQHIFFTYLLFDGPRQYGILSVEITPDELSFFYLMSLQIGTALHYLEMVKEQIESQEKLQEQNSFLNFYAKNDVLTGSLNRRGILEEFSGFCKRNVGKKAFLMIADLDHLKQINDNYGHDAGDFAIKQAAIQLKETLRKGALVGRIGGDEYLAIFLADEKKQNEIEEVVMELKDVFRHFNECSNKPYFIELSVGYTSFTCKEEKDMSKLTRRADARLYSAKAKRRKSISKNNQQG